MPQLPIDRCPQSWLQTNTLEVARNLKDTFQVVGLSSNSQWELLAEQVEEFKPRYVALTDCGLAEKLKRRFQGNQLKILTGNNCLHEIVVKREVDIVVSAVVGAVGLPAAIATIEQGKTLALANKESLVMAVASGDVSGKKKSDIARGQRA